MYIFIHINVYVTYFQACAHLSPYIHIVLLLLHQSGFWLVTIIKRQILEVETGEKGKGFLFKCSIIWEDWAPSVSRLIRVNSSPKHRQNSTIPRKTKTKGSAQNSHSILKNCPLEPRCLRRLLSVFRLPPRLCVWCWCCHWPCSFKQQGPVLLVVEVAKAQGNVPLGRQEREAPSWRPWSHVIHGEENKYTECRSQAAAMSLRAFFVSLCLY